MDFSFRKDQKNMILENRRDNELDVLETVVAKPTVYTQQIKSN